MKITPKEYVLFETVLILYFDLDIEKNQKETV